MLIDELDIFDNICDVDDVPVSEAPTDNSDISEERVTQVIINNYGGTGGYHHIQSAANTDWSFNHPLGRFITAVHIVDSGGTEWVPIKITNTDSANCTVHVGNAAYSGELWAI